MPQVLKIAIADDEKMACTVVEKLIDFDGIGLKLVGIAHDGFSLVELINSTSPDIVITDIQMPGLNGIELIQIIKEQHHHCKFIIISGYFNVNYSRSAIQCQVDDYLLKPIDAFELNETLKRLKKTIEFEQRGLDPSNAELVEQAMLSRHKLYISRLLNGDSIPHNPNLLKSKYGIEWADDFFQCAVAKLDVIDYQHDFSAGFSLLQSKIFQQFKKVMPKQVQMIWCSDTSYLYIIANFDQSLKNSIVKAFSDGFQFAQNVTSEYRGLRLTLGVSSVHQGVIMYDVLEEALCATYYRLDEGIEKMHLYSSSKKINPHEECAYKDLSAALEKAFLTLNIDAYQHCINSIFSTDGFKAADIVRFSLLVEDIFFDIVPQPESTNTGEMEYSRHLLHTGIQNAMTLAELKEHMLTTIGQIMRQRQKTINAQYSKPIRAAIAYIQAHYMDHLNLEIVSNHIAFSPIYFSNAFKKDTGENFIDFLNKFRVEKAKELLRTNSQNISEIAFSVGFNDPKYFTKTFRKYVGLKPTEYRNIYG